MKCANVHMHMHNILNRRFKYCLHGNHVVLCPEARGGTRNCLLFNVIPSSGQNNEYRVTAEDYVFVTGMKGYLVAGISVITQTGTHLTLPKHRKTAHIEVAINNNQLSEYGGHLPTICIFYCGNVSAFIFS